MVRICKYICGVLASLALMLFNGGCVEQLEGDSLSADGNVSFKATLDGGNDGLSTKGISGSLGFEEHDWIQGMSDRRQTKSSLLSSLDDIDAGVYAYVYNGVWNPETCSPLDLINGVLYTFDVDQLDTEEPVRWSLVEQYADDGHDFRAFVYAPKEAVEPTYEYPGSTPKGAPVIQIPDVFEKNSFGEYIYQNDIIVSDAVVALNYSTQTHRREIPLDFEHIYTAIQFKAGFDCTVEGISINGIRKGGDYVIGSGWKLDSQTHDYSMDIPSGGLAVTKDGSIGETLMLIPQEIDDDAAEIVVTYKENGASVTLRAGLDGVEWKRGKKITYTLLKESDKKYIYMDLAAGNVTVTGKKYLGYVFVNGVARHIEGTKSDGQEYYIYQSCVTDLNNTDAAVNGKRNYKVGWSGYDESKKQGTGTFTLPSYPVVEYEGMLWSDFITNNDDVEEVIEAWDDSKGANGNDGADAARAVRMAGRESTKNTISVTGNVGGCHMIIDNVYCSWQHPGANRSAGSITFIPTFGTNSELVLNLVGDNRLGSLHYYNNNGSEKGSDARRLANTNRLVIEGEGSLTVADADFFVSGGGYYSNHYDSAIGNSDNKNATYGIVINSGTVFAGTTMAENSSAIGGGGNGYGDVVINGGVVTAVASTTGTAIGGGIGFSDTGGLGYVEINGGNVYAYNHEHSSKIPSSAIGGAGSRNSAGSKGTVLITGGNVYAQSALGTAIGGGSSATRPGGEGNVTITGGTVIAKSLSKISAGIGGGSSCTGGGTLDSPNGGKAVITIGDDSDRSKTPVVRTGSIGGGGTNAAGGTVGSATIHVYGGDVQAQFVMAKSVGNVFDMQGGLIRNSSTSDDTYYCIKPHGAAVYMEQGTFTMSGGTIKECYADKTADSKGGAVYITGDDNTSFTMSGGEIRECRANADGGAVCLEGGSVTINGGTIYGNVAYNGNGGAVSVMGGSFTMDSTNEDTPAVITQNVAFDRGGGTNGNGGGIYVASVSGGSRSIDVVLEKGSITANSSDRNGGGVCIDMQSNVETELTVNVGEESIGPATNAMKVDGNNAQNKGGGMYVNGANANVVLYNGYVLDNETSSYQINPDIAVDGGLVTLMKPGITTQVTVTFSNNAQFYTGGTMADETSVQYVVAASRSRLNANPFTQINDYYNTFTGWYTRRDPGDSKGKSYADKALESFDEDIALYAQWE